MPLPLRLRARSRKPDSAPLELRHYRTAGLGETGRGTGPVRTDASARPHETSWYRASLPEAHWRLAQVSPAVFVRPAERRAIQPPGATQSIGLSTQDARSRQ